MGGTPFFSLGDEVSGIKKAAGIIKNGGLVAFPTETVYGLGADAFNAQAVSNIYKVKGRPGDNPLILHVDSIQAAASLAAELTTPIKNLMQVFWPGPLTIVLTKNPALPGWVGGHPNRVMETAAVRMPLNPVAQALIKTSGCVIAAPSANKAGTPSPTKAEHVLHDFILPDEIDFLLDGGEVDGGLESTVIDMSSDKPFILRPGAVTLNMLCGVLGKGKVEYNENASDSPRSPGQKYKHYAPNARVTIVTGTPANMSKKINTVGNKNGKTGILAARQTESFYEDFKPHVLIAGDREDLATVARNLYACLRRFDEMGVEEIYAEAVPETGVGRAIMNRLLKAAEGRVLHG